MGKEERGMPMNTRELDNNIMQLKAMAVALTALNDQLEALIYDIRYNSGICVGCGKNNIEKDGDEYCAECDKRSSLTRWAEERERK